MAPASAIRTTQHGRSGDETEGVAKRWRRVLTADPGMSSIRYIDAGYDKAIEEAREHSIKVPLWK